MPTTKEDKSNLATYKIVYRPEKKKATKKSKPSKKYFSKRKKK